MAKRSAIAVYAAGFLQGSAFVLIPALGSILAATPYHLSSSVYGLLYLPQAVGAIIGALGAGFLQKHIGSHGIFRLGVEANLVALILLVGVAHTGATLALTLLLLDSLFLGVGFGLTLATVNHYAALLFPSASMRAVTLLNAVIGGATALSPLILHAVASRANWGWWPAVLGLGFALLLLLPLPRSTRQQRETVRWQPGMAGFVTVVFIYAVCEGIFGSWATRYVTVTRGLTAQDGALALTLFWGSMTLLRTGLALVPESRVPRRWFYLAAPLGMAACFAVLPMLSSASMLIAAFALAGAACSIYYPFSMAYGLAAFAQQPTQMAGLLVAALMAGEGIGSFAPGPLQSWFTLNHIYLFAVLLTVPLWVLGRRLSAAQA